MKKKIKLILCVFIEIMYSLAIVLSKYLMDFKSCTPYEITFYEGIFALIINSILLAVFTNIPLDNNNKKYDDILRLTYYEGNKYIDNFMLLLAIWELEKYFYLFYLP